MIQPVNALSPKVFFKGGLKKSVKFTSNNEPYKSDVEEKIALMNAGGISTAIGATMTAISRSYTSSWKSASLIGACSAILAMTFLVPTFLYKAGIASYQSKTDKDVFIKDKNIIDGKKNNLASKIESYSKNLIKKAA